MEAVFAAAGYTSVAPAPHFGAECWFAVKCSTGAGVVCHWRASDWENEATLVHRLHSKFPGSFPALLDVLPADDGGLLVYSAVPGVSLAELVSGHSGRLPLPVILALGESLARAIALSHSARVMIGTLNARSVVFDEASEAARIVDFSSSRMFGEPNYGNPSGPFLPFLAPEQTGRTSTTPGYSADLYNMGALLYTAAVGAPPFGSPGEDASLASVASFVRRVLQEKPAPLHETLSGSEWKPITAIVSKLLEKSPADRYSSAYGVWRDFKCLREGAGSSFTPGAFDAQTQLDVTASALRAVERRLVSEGLLEASSTESGVLICVSGPPGSGKSTLCGDVVHAWASRDQRIPLSSSHRSSSFNRSSFCFKETASTEDASVHELDDLGPDLDNTSSGSTDQLGEGEVIVRGTARCESQHSQTPYHPIITSLTSAMRRMLSRSPSSRKRFADRLSVTLGRSLGLMVQLIPVLASFFPKSTSFLSVGESLEGLSAEESQSVQRQAIINLITTIASSVKPFVLFLDEMQYADPGSVRLVKQLVHQSLPAGLALILCTQSDASSSFVSELKSGCVWASKFIELGPLPLEEVICLVRHVTHLPPADAQAIGTVVLQQTAGNPLTIIQKMQRLYELDGLVLGSDDGVWRVDDAVLNEVLFGGQSEESRVLTLLASFPEEDQFVLGVCGCLGISSPLSLISDISQRPIEDVYKSLGLALQKSLVAIDSATSGSGSISGSLLQSPRVRSDASIRPPLKELHVRFVHDSVRVSSVGTLTGCQLASINYRIAASIAEGITAPADLTIRLFDLVSRLKCCDLASMECEQPWKYHHAELLSQAASRAYLANGFDDARLYASLGLTLLGFDVESLLSGAVNFESLTPLTVPAFASEDLPAAGCLKGCGCLITPSPDLGKQLFIKLGTSFRLSGKFDAAWIALNCARALCSNVIEVAQVRALKIVLLIMWGKFVDAVQLGLATLGLLGAPSDKLHIPTPEESDAAAVTTLDLLARVQGDSSLVTVFQTFTEQQEGVEFHKHKVITEFTTAAFNLNPAFRLYFAGMLIEGALSARILTPFLALAFTNFLPAAAKHGRIAFMPELASTANWLTNNVANSRNRGRVALQLACFHTWRHQSTHDDMQLLLTSRQLLVAEGDIPFIGYSVMHYVSRALFSSDNLVTSLEARHSDLELVKSTQAPDMIRFLEAHLCTTCELIGLDPPLYSKADITAQFRARKWWHIVFFLELETLFTEYLVNTAESAYAVCQSARFPASTCSAWPQYVIFAAMKALTLLKLLRKSGSSPELASELDAARTELQRLAAEAPLLLTSLHQLVEAETLSTDPASALKACELYDAAISTAEGNGDCHWQALACELAGAHYIRLGLRNAGLPLIRDAIQLYEVSWGASAVARRVSTEYSVDVKSEPAALHVSIPPPKRFPALTGSLSTKHQDSTSKLSAAVDFDATIHFCQALARQHNVSHIVKEFKRIVRQLTGATQVEFVLAADVAGDPSASSQSIGVSSRSTVTLSPQTFPRSRSDSAPFEGTEHPAVSRYNSTLSAHASLPWSLIRYSAGCLDTVLVGSIPTSDFAMDAYFAEHSAQSTLVVPLSNNDELFGIVYIEHDHAQNAFTKKMVTALSAIGTQFAISYELLKSTEQLDASVRTLQELSLVKDRFLATLSHELKTPLHSMSMCLGLLKETTVSVEQSNYLDILTSSSQVLQQLLNNLMELSRMKAGTLSLNPKPSNVQDIVMDVIRSAEGPCVSKCLELVVLVPSDLPRAALLDADRFKHMMGEFMTNAIKFSEPGGLIELTVEMYNRSSDEYDEASAASQWLRFSVRDTSGPGIPSGFRARLFEAFTQLDSSDSRRHGGFGNGLAMCKLVIDQMRGRVSVESDGVRGSRFTVELPVTVMDQSDVTVGEEETSAVVAQLTPVPFSTRSRSTSVASFAGKSVYGYCTRLSSSADVFGGYCRELGTVYVRTTSVDEVIALVDAVDATDRQNVVVVCDVGLLIPAESPLTRLLALGIAGVVCVSVGPCPIAHPLVQLLNTPVLRSKASQVLNHCFSAPLPPPLPTLPTIASADGVAAASPPVPPPMLAQLKTEEGGGSPSTKLLTPMSPKGPRSPPGASDSHILIVEDNKVNAKLLKSILVRAGFTADVAENGAIGAEMARTHEYCIILMDIQMPVMNGLDSTKLIRTFNSVVPIVAVTASVDDSERGLCLGVGMNGVVAKPIIGPKLIALIRSMLNSG